MIKSIECLFTPGKSKFEHLTQMCLGTPISVRHNITISDEVIKIYHLHTLIGENIFKYKKEILSYIRLFFDEFKTINKDIKVEYGGPSENNLGYIFLINNKKISIANKNKAFKKTSTTDIYNLCVELKNVVINAGPLEDYVKKYGHSVVFAILEIIAFDETLDFFRNYFKSLLLSRNDINRKILKEKFCFKSFASNKNFLNAILDIMEGLRKEYMGYLIETNYIELKKSDTWTMFAIKNENLFSFTFYFTHIKNTSIRKELLNFIRDSFSSNSPETTHALFTRVQTVLIHIPQSIQSITDITRADVIKLISKLSSQYKSHSLYKDLCSCAVFFEYTAALKKVKKNNSFADIKLVNDTDNTVPPDITDIQTMLKNSDTIPDHIKIPFMMLLETGARANEITGLKIDDIETSNGQVIIKKNLNKTDTLENHIPFVKNKLSRELSLMLNQFIKTSQPIRDKLDQPYVFVYEDKNKRDNSQNRFRVITSGTLLQHTKIWADQTLKKEKSNTITLKAIRTMVGTELFKYGYTSSQISDVLGNSPDVTEEHYINPSVLDEVNIRNKFFETTFNHVFENNLSSTAPATNTTLLGSCVSQMKCNKGNDCSVCEHRISCSKTI